MLPAVGLFCWMALCTIAIICFPYECGFWSKEPTVSNVGRMLILYSYGIAWVALMCLIMSYPMCKPFAAEKEKEQ